MMLTDKQLAFLRDRVTKIAEDHEIELYGQFESVVAVQLTRLIEGMITPPPERRFYLFECDLGPDATCYEYVIARDKEEAATFLDGIELGSIKKLEDDEHQVFLAPVRQPRHYGYARKSELVICREDTKVDETIYSSPSYYADDNVQIDSIAYHDKDCIHCKERKYGSGIEFPTSWGYTETHFVCWDCQKKLEQRKTKRDSDEKWKTINPIQGPLEPSINEVCEEIKVEIKKEPTR